MELIVYLIVSIYVLQKFNAWDKIHNPISSTTFVLHRHKIWEDDHEWWV